MFFLHSFFKYFFIGILFLIFFSSASFCEESVFSNLTTVSNRLLYTDRQKLLEEITTLFLSAKLVNEFGVPYPEALFAVFMCTVFLWPRNAFPFTLESVKNFPTDLQNLHTKCLQHPNGAVVDEYLTRDFFELMVSDRLINTKANLSLWILDIQKATCPENDVSDLVSELNRLVGIYKKLHIILQKNPDELSNFFLVPIEKLPELQYHTEILLHFIQNLP